MSDELVLGEKTYISSKRAASESGYAQDYVGQLARGGFIDAQRVGGLWYVQLDSLVNYKKSSDDARREAAPLPATNGDPESLVNFDGRDYVSASRASKISGYNQDYVGQLARSGKILSRQIGKRWYVDREALLTHKREKDALLAAVQVESVGLKMAVPSPLQTAPVSREQIVSYTEASAPLLPVIQKPQIEEMPVEVQHTEPSEINGTDEDDEKSAPRALPIRHVASAHIPAHRAGRSTPDGARRKGDTARLVGAVGMITIVLAAGVGLISSRGDSVYAMANQEGMPAAALRAFGSIGDIAERIVTRELVYERSR